MLTLPRLIFLFDLLLAEIPFVNCIGTNTSPVAINTWDLTNATAKAYDVLHSGGDAVDAIIGGCNSCEILYHACGESIGFGGSPDEDGETTLDAMVMDGTTHDVGAVAGLRQVKEAIRVAAAVMKYTKHTLLVGDLATQFAVEMGFLKSNLSTNDSIQLWENWKKHHCQPNFWQDVSPNPSDSCGPYKPDKDITENPSENLRYNKNVDPYHHDTIGMITLSNTGHMAAGTTTNGATYKIPGRVGDSPIMGAGAYVDSAVGGAAATGDGDVMMRFLPSYEVVRLMDMGASPVKAIKIALSKIAAFYPKFSGAMVALNRDGEYGGSCYGFSYFEYSVATSKGVKKYHMNCTQPQ